MHRGHTGHVNSTHALDQNMCLSYRPLCGCNFALVQYVHCSIYVTLQVRRRLLCNFYYRNARLPTRPLPQCPIAHTPTTAMPDCPHAHYRNARLPTRRLPQCPIAHTPTTAMPDCPHALLVSKDSFRPIEP